MSICWRILKNMADKFINRYNSYCKCVNNLQNCKTANPMDDFVIEGTVTRFNLSFDLAWKVMKDILVKRLGVLDYALGSPRGNLEAAFANGLINDDVWIQMLKTRNQLAHDYDGSLAERSFDQIVGEYYDAFCKFRDVVEKYYIDNPQELNSFSEK